jgi:hypothetical protein
MVSENPATEKTLERLRSVRHALLGLHKVLMEYQRNLWERRSGQVNNSYELLKLVMNDPEFSWLHRLSELVVAIDELFDADEPPTEADANNLLEQARLLIVPSETGDEFQRQYFEALQQSPDVVLAHSEVVGLLGRNTEIH